MTDALFKSDCSAIVSPEIKNEDQQLRLLVSQIVCLVRPLKIYLFGSRATGKFQDSSDYDLMIVMPDGTHRRKTAQLLYEKISSVNVPFDLIVTTEESLIKNAPKPGLIYRQALKQGYRNLCRMT